MKLTTEDTLILIANLLKKQLIKEVPWAVNLFGAQRYKIFHGGRAGLKSWTLARALIIISCLEKGAVLLCCRQFLKSMTFSVHLLLKMTIFHYKLENYFHITHNTIVNKITKSQCIFYGLATNVQNIKSIPNIRLAWAEEASDLTAESWDILTPTVRENRGQIWASFNPVLETDVLYDLFVKNNHYQEMAFVHYSNYLQNPFLSEALKKEAEIVKKKDYAKYEHIWLGKPKRYDDAIVFKEGYHFVIEEFDDRIYDIKTQGLDYGYRDALACIQLWIKGFDIYILYEAYGSGVEIDNIKPFCEKTIPNFARTRTYADSAQPNLTSYLKRKECLIESVQKGGVKDGVEFLLGHKMHIHPRCVNTIYEVRNYKFKKDPKTNAILTEFEDKKNHAIDAIRYGIEQHRVTGIKNYAEIKLNAIASLMQ